MLEKLNIQLFGGRGQNFKLKRDRTAKDSNNSEITIPKGTEFKNVIVIAGDDRKRKIDQVKSLVNKYGGKEKNWSKRIAIATIDNKNAEVHYYQNKKDNIGRVKFKIKKWL